MLTVVNNSMVAHLWANKSQSKARSGTMSFNKSSIYSYRAEIARHFKNVVLFSDKSYSVTTSQHQNIIRQAASHLTVITVKHLGIDPAAINTNFKYFTSEIDRLMRLSVRARSEHSRNWYLTRANDVRENANQYARVMKRTRKFSPPDPESVKTAVKKTRKIEALKRKRQIAECAETMRAWENGENVYIPFGDIPVCLRLRDDKTIETSLGAKFPLSHGKRIYKFTKKCRETKTSYAHNGHTLRAGNFSIDSISKSGDVKAGCHFVKWNATQRFAKRMGW